MLWSESMLKSDRWLSNRVKTVLSTSASPILHPATN